MKLNILSNTVMALGLMLASCADKDSEWSQWPEWNIPETITVNGTEFINASQGNSMSCTLTIRNGETMVFKGLSQPTRALQPEWFARETDDTFIFLGPTADYSLVYDIATGLVYVDRRSGSFPEAIWMTGEGWGHPGASAVTCGGWRIDEAKDMITCVRSSKGIFETTVFLSDDFKIKFFKFHAWENEFHAGNLKIATPLVFAHNSTNDFTPGPLARPGTYRIIVDTNLGTVSAEGVDVKIELPEFKVNGVALASTTEFPTMLSARVFLKEGSPVSFDGFRADLEKMIQPDWFGDCNDGKATFKGESGTYILCYDLNNKVMYVQVATVAYPKYVLMCGTGFGHPGLDFVTSGQFNLTEPSNAILCRKVSNMVYEATVWLSGDFHLKCFRHRDWGAGVGPEELSPVPENIVRSDIWEDEEGFAHATGDIVAGSDFRPGCYTIRFDFSKHVAYLVGTVDNPEADFSTLKVNGVSMTGSSIAGYMSVDLDLVQGQKMTFDGFRYVKYMLQPEYFDLDGNDVSFQAPSGRYRLWYSAQRLHLYVEALGDKSYPDGLWITGYDFSHPAGNGNLAADHAGLPNGNWAWDDPKDFVCCVPLGNGVYETCLRLNDNFMFRFFDNKGSWNDIITPLKYDVSRCGGIFRDDHVNFCQGPDWTPGTYRLTVDTGARTVEARRITLK